MSGKIDSPLAVIKSTVAPLRGASILDVGRGGGGLVRQLASDGANVTGIDPNPSAKLTARKLVPGAKFVLEIFGAQGRN